MFGRMKKLGRSLMGGADLMFIGFALDSSSPENDLFQLISYNAPIWALRYALRSYLVFNGPDKTINLVSKAPYLKASPLHIAAKNGNVGILKVLLEYGADLNQCSPSGEKVPWAEKDSFPDSPSYLMEFGKYFLSNNSFPPLLWAVKKKDPKMLGTLLSSPRTNKNLTWEKGRVTAHYYPYEQWKIIVTDLLCEAASLEWIEGVQILLDSGACVQKFKTDSPDALSVAIRLKSKTIVTSLLKGDPGAFITGSSMPSRLSEAACYSTLEMVQLLVKFAKSKRINVADPKTIIPDLLQNPNITLEDFTAIIDSILDFDVTYRLKDGRTLLHHALGVVRDYGSLRDDYFEVKQKVAHLLSLGNNLHIQDAKGRPLWHEWIYQGSTGWSIMNWHVVSTLLKSLAPEVISDENVGGYGDSLFGFFPELFVKLEAPNLVDWIARCNHPELAPAVSRSYSKAYGVSVQATANEPAAWNIPKLTKMGYLFFAHRLDHPTTDKPPGINSDDKLDSNTFVNECPNMYELIDGYRVVNR